MSQAEAAKLMRVSTRQVQREAAVRRHNRKLHDDVKAGRITLSDAAKQVAKKKADTKETAKPQPKGEPKSAAGSLRPTTSASPTAPKTPGMISELYKALDKLAESAKHIESVVDTVPVTERPELRQRTEAALEQLQKLLTALTPSAM